MSKHTPGPWFTKREGFSTVYVEARIDGGLIQEVAACGPTQEGQQQQEANARLIAAAPDLLAALQEARIALSLMLSYHGQGTSDYEDAAQARASNACDVVDAAIAKATGAQP